MSFDPALFASTFALIFVAELPDKTALATVLMSARRHPVAVFVGAAGAFAVQSAVAVIFGGFLHRLPERAVRVGAGLLFLAFAWSMWREKEDEHTAIGDGGAGDFVHAARSAFLVVFVAEWGDLTQLATAALAAKHGAPWTIFAASTAALWSVAAIAAFVGSRLKGRLHPERLRRGAAIAFAAAGAWFLFGR